MNNEQYDSEQINFIILIYLMMQSAEYEWNNMRDLACDDINKTKIDE